MSQSQREYDAAVERDERYVRLALDEALVALEHGDLPVGAVLVLGEDVVSRAHNTQELWGDPTGHAEVNALRLGTERLGGWRLEGCELFVTLEPCPMCAMAAVWARLDRLVFGAWNPRSGACGSLYNIPEDPRLPYRVEVRRGVLPGECARPLAAFFDELRADTRAGPDAPDLDLRRGGGGI